MTGKKPRKNSGTKLSKKAAVPRQSRLPSQVPGQREDSRAKLVDVALRILLEKGIDAVRVDEVVAAAGVTKGSLYWHFSDRNSLIKEALHEYVRRLNAELVDGISSAIAGATTTNDYLARIAPVLVDPFDPVKAHDLAQRLSLMIQAKADPELAPLMREVQVRSLTVYTDLMREAQSKGFIKPELDPRAVATALHAINFGSVVIDVVGDEGPTRDAWWGLMLFFIGSLVAPPEAAGGR